MVFWETAGVLNLSTPFCTGHYPLALQQLLEERSVRTLNIDWRRLADRRDLDVLRTAFHFIHHHEVQFAVEQADFNLAVVNLGQIKKVTPEQAVPFFSALAYANYEIGNKIN